MPVSIQCPNPQCAASIAVPEDEAARLLHCPKCHTALPLGAASGTGGMPTQIGRYEVRAKIGAGAFGAVYRAHDPHLDREVALKLLKPEALSSPKAIERFRREARAAARMFHPNIVPVFDAGQHGDSHFIASAFVAGRSLASAIPEHGMAPRRAAALTAQLADALAYAHQQGVLHRDVKPANVMLDNQDRVYLTDFGLAVWTGEERSRLTRLGAVVGPPAFMSPEQATGDPSQVGPASDQYSAGVVLYQLLTGRLPFEGPPSVVLFLVADRPPPSPSEVRPGLDPALVSICLKTLAKRPADRYSDAAALAAALRGWVTATMPSLEATVALPPPLPNAIASVAPPSLVPPVVLPAPVLPPPLPPVASVRRRQANPRATTATAPPPLAVSMQAAIGTLESIETQPHASRPPHPSTRAAAPSPSNKERNPWRAVRWTAWMALTAAGVTVLTFLILFALKRAGKRSDEPTDLKPNHVEGKDAASRPTNSSDKRAEGKEPEKPTKTPEQAAEDKQREKTDLTRDIEAIEKALLTGKGSAAYVKEHGPERLASWRAAAERGSGDGEYLLARCYQEGSGTEKDLEAAAVWLLKSAGHGNALAQYELGNCHAAGEGVPMDLKEAVAWYRSAAVQELATAKYQLALCYESGKGVHKELPKAAEWYRAAAELGYGEAWVRLEALTTSHAWYVAAAERGDALAQYNLGLAYEKGRGVQKSRTLALVWFQKAAEQGNAASQHTLGRLYEKGRLGVLKDHKKAFAWYLKAAEQEYAAAQFDLGRCYYDGIGVVMDRNKAAEWFRKAAEWYSNAAEKRNADARFNLANCYLYGKGVERDYTMAFKWYDKAAEQGNADAQCGLGRCYHYGWGVEKNVKLAAVWFRKAAEQGNAVGQHGLGVCYYLGAGVDKDLKKAVEWYRKAADQELDMAQCNLGSCYEHGKGVDKDLKEAVEWYRRAADQDYKIAQNNLGCCYDYGLGVDQDSKKAVEWYNKAAEKIAAGQYNLGYCYEHGRGVVKDMTLASEHYLPARNQKDGLLEYKEGLKFETGKGANMDQKKAVECYRKAAGKNHAVAQNSLGSCYEEGRGVQRDLTIAVTWYKAAADQGNPIAQYNLGSCYANGKGVDKDLKKAAEFYQQAAEAGLAVAKYALHRVTK